MRPSDALLDTVVAPATAAGRSALAIVRLSGKDARRILRSLAPDLPEEIEVRRPRLTAFVDAEGEAIDTGLATFYAAPASATGEDVAEISIHGSPLGIQRILEAAIRSGARPARPGEFTERAFRAGKIDLVRAEAVRDLIEARTPAAARASAGRLVGLLSASLGRVRDSLMTASAGLAAAIDFSEDTGERVSPAVPEALRNAIASLTRLSATAETGRLLSQGCRVAILGRPNAGKSTLFNAILGSPRAIVTAIPGTTRDVLEAEIDVGGIPVTLADTAGLRETEDLIETMGVERARNEAVRADAVIYVFDAAAGWSAEDARAVGTLDGRPRIVVANKADAARPGASHAPEGAVWLCGLAPEAGPTLLSALSGTIAGELRLENASEILGSLRQRDLVGRAREASAEALSALEAGDSPEYAAARCHGALDALADLAGETTPDDVLDRVFSTFCIGK